MAPVWNGDPMHALPPTQDTLHMGLAMAKHEGEADFKSQ